MYIVYLNKKIILLRSRSTSPMLCKKSVITLKCHHFEVVTHEIFDFEGHKYEEADYFQLAMSSQSSII